jgi:hypothetical protein
MFKLNSHLLVVPGRIVAGKESRGPDDADSYDGKEHATITSSVYAKSYFANQTETRSTDSHALEEREQVGVYDVGVGGRHTVRKAMIGFQDTVLYKLRR